MALADLPFSDAPQEARTSAEATTAVMFFIVNLLTLLILPKMGKG